LINAPYRAQNFVRDASVTQVARLVQSGSGRECLPQHKSAVKAECSELTIDTATACDWALTRLAFDKS
jgi:hypothetical protein